MLKGALREPQPDQGDSYQRVSGPSWSAAAQSALARFGLQASGGISRRELPTASGWWAVRRGEHS
jgi:hypothetical protein